MSQVLLIDVVDQLTFYRPKPHFSCHKCPKTVLYLYWKKMSQWTPCEKNESIPTRIAWAMAEIVLRLLRAVGTPPPPLSRARFNYTPFPSTSPPLSLSLSLSHIHTLTHKLEFSGCTKNPCVRKVRDLQYTIALAWLSAIRSSLACMVHAPFSLEHFVHPLFPVLAHPVSIVRSVSRGLFFLVAWGTSQLAYRRQKLGRSPSPARGGPGACSPGDFEKSDAIICIFVYFEGH